MAFVTDSSGAVDPYWKEIRQYFVQRIAHDKETRSTRPADGFNDHWAWVQYTNQAHPEQSKTSTSVKDFDVVAKEAPYYCADAGGAACPRPDITAPSTAVIEASVLLENDMVVRNSNPQNTSAPTTCFIVMFWDGTFSPTYDPTNALSNSPCWGIHVATKDVYYGADLEDLVPYGELNGDGDPNGWVFVSDALRDGYLDAVAEKIFQKAVQTADCDLMAVPLTWDSVVVPLISAWAAFATFVIFLSLFYRPEGEASPPAGYNAIPDDVSIIAHGRALDEGVVPDPLVPGETPEDAAADPILHYAPRDPRTAFLICCFVSPIYCGVAHLIYLHPLRRFKTDFWYTIRILTLNWFCLGMLYDFFALPNDTVAANEYWAKQSAEVSKVRKTATHYNPATSPRLKHAPVPVPGGGFVPRPPSPGALSHRSGHSQFSGGPGGPVTPLVLPPSHPASIARRGGPRPPTAVELAEDMALDNLSGGSGGSGGSGRRKPRRQAKTQAQPLNGDSSDP